MRDKCRRPEGYNFNRPRVDIKYIILPVHCNIELCTIIINMNAVHHMYDRRKKNSRRISRIGRNKTYNNL